LHRSAAANSETYRFSAFAYDTPGSVQATCRPLEGFAYHGSWPRLRSHAPRPGASPQKTTQNTTWIACQERQPSGPRRVETPVVARVSAFVSPVEATGFEPLTPSLPVGCPDLSGCSNLPGGARLLLPTQKTFKKTISASLACLTHPTPNALKPLP
jgi:hypothetical protein